MASSSKRDKERDVDTTKSSSDTVVGSSAVEAVVEDVVVPEFSAPDVVAPEPVATAGKLSAKIQATIDSAAKGWTIKVKSKADFDAASAALKVSNPKSLKVVHKPGLGHHSVAVG